ncbi:MAG: hypothetical protein Q4E33_00630 [Erysipelotrichaceae bacterium]|nr:hypothetical protein [Erysipelotrichaceae bacterium]
MRYLNKLLTVLISLTLFGCSSNQEIIQEEIEYIEPMKEVFIFEEIDRDLQNKILYANNNLDYQNYQFKMLFSDIYDQDVEDIFGNVVNLNDYKYLVFDVISTECSHCKKIVSEYLDDYLNGYPDYQFVQYFDEGNKDDILKFYSDLGVSIPEKVIIIERSDELHDYIYNKVGMKAYPTLNFFLDGKLRYSTVGELDIQAYRKAIEVGFIDPIEQEDLLNNDGESLLELDRSIDDVKKSLSKENQDKIANLSEDKYTEELTYKLMGSKCDYDDLLKGNAIYISEIDDYSYYKDKQVVLLYIFLESIEDEDRIDKVNELIASNDNYEYIVVFIESTSSSSTVYKKMNKKIEGAPIVSILGKMPADFYNYGMVAFPSAVFIDKSTFTGGYSKINDVESFNYALDLFLSDNSVAYVKNN